MKKQNVLIITAILAIIMIAGCKKAPHDITITASATVANVDEAISFTINDPEYYDFLNWCIEDSAGTEIYQIYPSAIDCSFISTVSGGGESDLSWIVKIAEKGTYTVTITVFSETKNGEDTKRANVDITIQ